MGGKPTKECVTEHCNKMVKRNPAEKLWSVDECYFSEKIVPLYVYCKRGQKVSPKSPIKSWKQHTLLLAISNDGDIRSEVFLGTCKRIRFESFVRTLPGDFICDNASIHKGLEMTNLSFVPPYSHKIVDFKSS
jgi:hypothetical protein